MNKINNLKYIFVILAVLVTVNTRGSFKSIESEVVNSNYTVKDVIKSNTKEILKKINQLPCELIDIIKNLLINENKFLLIDLFKTTQELTGHTGSVYSVAFSPNGKLAFTGSYGGIIRLWNLNDLTNITSPELTGHTCGGRSVAFSPNRCL